MRFLASLSQLFFSSCLDIIVFCSFEYSSDFFSKGGDVACATHELYVLFVIIMHSHLVPCYAIA